MTRHLVATGLTVGQHSDPAQARVRYVGKPADVVRLMRDPELPSTIVLTQGGAVTFVGALLPRRPVGLITIEGAPESHLGIICREFAIPAVMSVALADDGGVGRVDGHGLTASGYVWRVVEQLDGRLVELDCTDAEVGQVFVLPDLELTTRTGEMACRRTDRGT